MVTNEKKHSHFFTGLVIGGIVGGLASLLLAPKSGKELRADIKETGAEALGETKAMLGKASQQVSEARQGARHIVSCIKERGETTPQYKVESAEESVGEA
jgi:gas vesicle protein